MKVLIVVDMQYDFVNMALGSLEAQAIVPNVVKAIKDRANEDTLVIFTKDTHTDNYMNTQEGKNLPVPHCIEGSVGHSIVDEVIDAYMEVNKNYMAPKNANLSITADPILRIEKPTFGSVELQKALIAINEKNPIEEITLMGLCTGICVLSNAILAKVTLPEVPVNVIADCCACITPESHKNALEAMKLCQINIL